MGLADLHIHTVHSHDGTCSVAAVLKYASEYTNLSVVAITDHNSIRGNVEAMQLAPMYGLEVIPGCEISTADGHLLALFIKELIPARLSLFETIERVGEQGGICVAPHPSARGTSALSFEVIAQAIADTDLRKVLVGIEAFNGGLFYSGQNDLIEEECRRYPMAQCGNSDAHILGMIGQGMTRFEGTSAQALRAALISRETKVERKRMMNSVVMMKNYLSQRMMRKLGWVTHSATPGAPFSYARLPNVLS